MPNVAIPRARPLRLREKRTLILVRQSRVGILHMRHTTNGQDQIRREETTTWLLTVVNGPFFVHLYERNSSMPQH